MNNKTKKLITLISLGLILLLVLPSAFAEDTTIQKASANYNIDDSNYNTYFTSSGTTGLNDGDEIKISTLNNKDLIIDKNLTITGGELKDSTITFTSTSSGSTLKQTTITGSGELITINRARDITIQENTITNTNFDGSTIYGINAYNLKIDNNKIISTGSTSQSNQAYIYSIYILNSNTVYITNNNINTNGTAKLVTRDSDNNPTYRTLSIYAQDSPNSYIEKNTITTGYNKGTGEVDTVISVYMSLCEDSEFKDNTVTTYGNRYAYGADFSNNDAIQIEKNQFTTKSQYYAAGITIGGILTEQIINNIINAESPTVTYGIFASNYDMGILACNYKDNTINTKSTYTMGIQIYGNGYNNISSNKITVNGEYGLGVGILASSDWNFIQSNTIVSTGTKYGKVNYMDLLDFENTGVAVHPLTDDDKSTHTIIRYNTITVKGEYTVNLYNTTYNTVRFNELRANEWVGDESVYNVGTGVLISDNTPKPQSGTVLYVSNNGSNTNSGTRNAPLKSLQTALNRIEDGGEVIILTDISESGLLLEKCVTISGINRDITIDGMGNGFMDTRSAEYGVKKLVIRNLCIRNASTIGGSVLLSFAGELYLENITLYNNTDEVNSVGFYGPISNYGTLYVDNCIFYQNSGTAGGAIYTTGDATIRNSIFYNNKANNGGAIATNQQTSSGTTTLKIINCTFFNNKATTNGGAIFTQYSNVEISHSSFIENSAERSGGLYYGNGNLNTKTYITYSVILDNTCLWPDWEIRTFQQSVYANYNWWGNNTGGTGRYSTSEGFPVTMDITRPVVMTLNLNETLEDSIPTVITGSLNKYSYRGALYDLTEDIPNRNVSFISNNGRFTNRLVETSEGSASSTFTGTSVGNLTVRIDNQELSLNTTVVLKNTSIAINNSIVDKWDSVNPVFIVTDSRGYPVDSGLMLLTLGDEDYYASVNNGFAVFNLGNLSVGEYNVDVLYSAPNDGRYNSSNGNFNFTVRQSSVPIIPPSPPSPVNPTNGSNESSYSVVLNVNSSFTSFAGEDLSFSVNVLDNSGGLVNSGALSLSLDDVVYNASVSAGLGVFTIKSPNSSGEYTLNIEYIDNNIRSSTKSKLTVIKNDSSPVSTSLIIGFSELNEGGIISGKVIAEDNEKLNGEISLTIMRLSNNQSRTYKTNLSNGEFSYSVSLGIGEYLINGEYSGDSKYLASDNNKLISIIGKASTAILEDKSFIDGIYGDTIAHEGVLTDSNGSVLIGYHIAVNITRLSSGASKVYYLTTDYEGNYKLPINLAPGDYVIRTSINDNGYVSSSLTNLHISRSLNDTYIDAGDVTIHYNMGEKFTGYLKTYGGETIIGHHLDLTLSNSRGQSKTYDVVSDYTGEFSLPINLAPGIYSILITYNGVGAYSSSSLTSTITVI